jgi:hypothetical protein
MNLKRVVGRSRDEVKNNLTAEVQVASTRLHFLNYSQTDSLQHRTSSREAAYARAHLKQMNQSRACRKDIH